MIIRFILGAGVLLASYASYAASVGISGKANFQVPATGLTIKGDCPVAGTAEEKDGVVTGKFFVALTGCTDAAFDLRAKHTQEYLETAKYDTATLVIKPWKNSAATSPFEGELTLHGVTKPVTGKANVAGGKVHAEFTFDVTQFGLSEKNYKGIGVKKDVTVDVDADIK